MDIEVLCAFAVGRPGRLGKGSTGLPEDHDLLRHQDTSYLWGLQPPFIWAKESRKDPQYKKTILTLLGKEYQAPMVFPRSQS